MEKGEVCRKDIEPSVATEVLSDLTGRIFVMMVQ